MQNQNSGGWRYGNGSNDFLYKNEGIDNELLKRAAGMTEAPKGLLDQAVQVNPLDKLMQQSTDSGSGNSSTASEASASTGKASDGWGANAMGYNVGYSPMAGMKGVATMGPLGALAGLQVSKDPLGQFAYQALVAQEARDTANSLGAGLTGLGTTGGFNDSVTSGGDFGGSYSGGFGTGNEGAGFSDGISGGSFGDGGYGGGFGDGGYGGGFGDSGGFGGSDSDGAGGYGGSDNGYYKGGKVTHDRLSGPNPAGPDDGYAALQDGEYVIKASSVKKYGKGLLADINSGKYKA